MIRGSDKVTGPQLQEHAGTAGADGICRRGRCRRGISAQLAPMAYFGAAGAVERLQNQSCQTGVTLAGSGGSAAKSTRASPGAWKSVPRDARKP